MNLTESLQTSKRPARSLVSLLKIAFKKFFFVAVILPMFNLFSYLTNVKH